MQRSIAVAGVTVLLPLLVQALRGGEHDPAWLSLALGLCCGGLGWVGAILGLRHPLNHEFTAMVREMRAIIGRMA